MAMASHEDAYIARLRSGDSSERDVAVEVLGDLLAGGVFDPSTAEAVVKRLVAVAVEDHDRAVRESALSSISSAFNRYAVPLEVVAPLGPVLPSLDPALLEYALYVLAVTHDAGARPAIAAFEVHPDPVVRKHAAEALFELEGRESQGIARVMSRGYGQV